MPHRRRKLPGSFQDELGELVKRIAPPEGQSRSSSETAKRSTAGSTTEMNDSLFEQAWRKDR